MTTRPAAPPSTNRVEPPSPQPRLHGLDALRGGALLLGIVLHGLMPFVAGMGWMISDTRPTAWAMPTITVVHLFRMVLFMLLAGYFARLVVGRRGMPRFLRERTVRIALPVFAFWPVSVMSLGLIAGAWATARGITLLPPPSEPGTPQALLLFTPGQLWFLWSLYQCCLLLAAVRWSVHRVAPRMTGVVAQTSSALLTGPWAVPILALPYGVTLVWQASTYAGVDEPRTLLPEASSLLTYFAAVVAGWLLARRADGLDRIAGRRQPHLVIAGIGSVLVLLLTGQLGVPAASGPWHLVTAGVSAVTAWAWVYGLLGCCTALLRRDRFWVRYLADASYWMYLLHLPLLVAIGGTMTDLPWPATLKVLLTMGATTVVLVLSYDAVVRSTWIGAWLNGHRRPRAIFRLRAVLP